MRKLTVTKAQSAKLAALKAALGVASDSVFAAAQEKTGRNDIRFSDCLTYSDAAASAYVSCRDALWQFEDDIIGQGRAYRDQFGAVRAISWGRP